MSGDESMNVVDRSLSLEKGENMSECKTGSKTKDKSEGESIAKADPVQAILLSPAGGRTETPKELWRRVRNPSGIRREASSPDVSGQQPRKQKDDGSLKGILKSGQCKEPISRSSSAEFSPIPAIDGTSTSKNTERVTRFRQPSALRKSHSVSDVRRTSLDLTSGIRSRRMSTSHVAHDASRRSSMASITISLSRPDSLDSHILYEPPEDPFDLYPVIPETSSNAQTSLNQESTRSSIRHPIRSPRQPWSSVGPLQSERHNRRNSCPGAVNPASKSSPSTFFGTSSKNKVVSPKNHLPLNSPRSGGNFHPASRPSSVLNGNISSRKSSIAQIGCISRPWTPTSTSPPSGSRNWSVHRNPFQNRTAPSMVAPLQVLNAKVRNILGCTNNILDFYGKHPDADPNRNRIRAARITQSMKMNRKKIEPVVAVPRAIRTVSRPRAKGLSRPPVASTKDGKSGKKPLQSLLKVKSSPNPSATSTPGVPTPSASEFVAPAPNASESEATVSEVPASEAPASEGPMPEDPVSEDPASEAQPTDATTIANLIKVKWKTLASSTIKAPKETFNEPTKSNTPWKSVKMPKTRKSGGGNNAIGVGGVGMIDPVVSTLVQTLMRQRNNQSKRNRTGVVGNIFLPVSKLEQYTDKDRAAAVLLGDTDIKTTLEKQMKSDRGRYVMPKESSAQVYLVQADFEMRIGGLTTAHRLLNKVRISNISS